MKTKHVNGWETRLHNPTKCSLKGARLIARLRITFDVLYRHDVCFESCFKGSQILLLDLPYISDIRGIIEKCGSLFSLIDYDMVTALLFCCVDSARAVDFAFLPDQSVFPSARGSRAEGKA